MKQYYCLKYSNMDANYDGVKIFTFVKGVIKKNSLYKDLFLISFCLFRVFYNKKWNKLTYVLFLQPESCCNCFIKPQNPYATPRCGAYLNCKQYFNKCKLYSLFFLKLNLLVVKHLFVLVMLCRYYTFYERNIRKV